ncbi:MAG: hypothetical protein ACRCTL_17635 [Pseudomonas sp.]
MRRTEIVEITEGRDAGKKYQITEMSAEAAEWWAFRALQAIASSEVDLDLQAPMAELARTGLKAMASVSPAQAKPLLDEMMTCVQIMVPATQNPRKLMDGDIEDVKTRFLLRKAVMELHLGFSTGGEEQI